MTFTSRSGIIPLVMKESSTTAIRPSARLLSFAVSTLLRCEGGRARAPEGERR